ncbi:MULTISPECIES: hypothetical protein [unclassified Microcoleus]|uniref:hypothetical protein n=1 Tax=unclassified Microcoleus TaxID=2642155 RepID=UPI0025FFC3C2|nr:MULTISPECIES: hypothetical protein [unclassified Microcoleus]
MVRPGSDESEYSRGYQQALNDFGVTQLLSRIRCYSDDDFDANRARMTQPELESFAVFLILRVGANLNGSAIARYLNTLRKANSPTIADRAYQLNSNARSKTSEESDRISWAIVRILPNAEHYTIARFVNRQDADDRRRALCRFIPGGVFEVVWECDRA